MLRNFKLWLQYHSIIFVSVAIVDEFNRFSASRPGGDYNHDKQKESNMKVHRFLALCGYTEADDSKDSLVRADHLRVPVVQPEAARCSVDVCRH
ncbi:hypothetical protein DPMN_065281 [Dreissena polymorpha]|uniref:Uncharacterized protein n=1 Tax=Dreissena polymorpha TaxID=45954 RepID=A0A9D4CFG5_DREPO|nr:hypothetical protein DPMN_065281 [Dreissena polymorpha]